jgi:hypothetical protein
MPINSNHNPLAHFFSKHKETILKHKDKFIWFHSTYALILGIGLMWLGSKNFKYIRLAIIQITFIWLSSLAIPLILNHRKLNPKWKERIRLLINYFNRNFYQQLLFFVLPIYYMSATLKSKNILFIILVAISAVLSTMDIVYDRFISLKAIIMSLFFAINLFATINVMAPILWGIQVVHSVRISAALAFIGFATFSFKLSNVDRNKKKLIIAAAAVMFFIISEYGRPFIPPAPLQLDKTEFGLGIKSKLQIVAPLSELPTGTHKIYAITSIKASLKLKEMVKISWFLNGRPIFSTNRFFEISGKGEKAGGFRIWTFYTLKNVRPDSYLMIEAETEGGQLIGRSYLPF